MVDRSKLVSRPIELYRSALRRTSAIRVLMLLFALAVLGLVTHGGWADEPPASSGAPARPASGSPPVAVPPPGPGSSDLPPPLPPAPASLPLGQQAAPRRFQFKIPPSTPLKELLPVPPEYKNTAGPAIATSLSQVPEVQFQAPMARRLTIEEATEQTAHSIAKINHLNKPKTDGFMDALCRSRPDLAGLPFAMGDACRTKGDRSREFATAVATVRAALQPVVQAQVINAAPPAFVAPPTSSPASQPAPAPTTPIQPMQVDISSVNFSAIVTTRDRSSPEVFWEQFESACAQEDKKVARVDRAQQENILLARLAALMQVLAPESPSMRLGLVKYLSKISHIEATQALARLAVFSPEQEVRQAAIDALKVRRERDYTEILVQSLHYPWPEVAQHGAEAIVRLERTDLLPQLVEVLDEPDPRAPVVKKVNDRTIPVVRELVKINHHRNCLMCHAPGNTETVSPEALTAGVPVPGVPFPAPSMGYQTTSPDLLVRIDVTYLRQDFSMFQAVADANPWPEMQRFDYLVRARELTNQEAATVSNQLKEREKDRLSPYHRTVLAALRDLTGRDTEPTAAAWRGLLQFPNKANSITR